MMNEIPSHEARRIRAYVSARYGALAEQADERAAAAKPCGDEPAAAGTDAGCCGGGSACCDRDGTPYGAKLGYSAAEMAAAPAGADLGLGCGNPLAIASIRPGETVLDLGSGAGFDCFLAARQLAGTGRVIGVDFAAPMIAKARANAAKAGYANVEFRPGEIEALPVDDASVDLIISNCVINLSPEKPRVFREAFRVLKPGGRISVADIVATQPVPPAIARQLSAIGACVGGAAPVEDLRAMLAGAGFERIGIAVRESSREYIRHWTREAAAGDFVASALITAYKPGPAVRNGRQR